MSKKSISLDGIGNITVYKRKGAKKIRLRVTSDGLVRVTIPYWAPYKTGILFAVSKKSWLLSQLPKKPVIHHDASIGKSHRVIVQHSGGSEPVKVRCRDGAILARVPFGTEIIDETVQSELHKACVRALRTEAVAVLPVRLTELAKEHGFTYNSVSIKAMKSRWGSCTQQKNISLNVYLMQLDDDVIDYVLLHELLHTRVLAHGKPFWSELAVYVSDLPVMRKRIRALEPRLLVR